MIVIDTETCLGGPACKAPPLVCVAIGGAAQADVLHWTEAEPRVRALFEGARTIVGHHIAYDCAVLCEAFPHLMPLVFEAYDADRITDTGLRQKLIDIAGGVYRRTGYGYGLDDLVERYFAIVLDKEDTWRLRYGELRDVPVADWPEEARTYPMLDVACTARVFEFQEPSSGLLADQYRQARAAFWLYLMSCWGLTTDAAAVQEFASRTQAEHDRIAADLRACGLLRSGRFNRKGAWIPGARDTKAAALRMGAAMAGDVARTATGKVALDDDACRKSGDPLLVAYADFSSLGKRLSTDVPLLERGLIHARFEELLETGRTSSSPNVQNLATGRSKSTDRRIGGLPTMRECFVPRDGFVFVSVDYSQMELRTLAQACITWLGQSKLAEALNAGRDPHTAVAAAILGITYEDAVARKKDADVDKARQVGKCSNFGFPGGLGATRLVHFAALQYGVILTEAQARRLKVQWFNAWPEMPLYFRLINEFIERGACVEQLFSGRFRGGLTYCEACNTPFQGLAADAAKAAGWLVCRACYVDRASPLFGCRIVNFVHDEILIEAPEPRAHEAAEELARLMVAGAAPWLPDVPPTVDTPALMRCWSKKAQGIRDAGGRLIPWDG